MRHSSSGEIEFSEDLSVIGAVHQKPSTIGVKVLLESNGKNLSPFLPRNELASSSANEIDMKYRLCEFRKYARASPTVDLTCTLNVFDSWQEPYQAWNDLKFGPYVWKDSAHEFSMTICEKVAVGTNSYFRKYKRFLCRFEHLNFLTYSPRRLDASIYEIGILAVSATFQVNSCPFEAVHQDI